jgi:hypothetical protein
MRADLSFSYPPISLLLRQPLSIKKSYAGAIQFACGKFRKCFAIREINFALQREVPPKFLKILLQLFHINTMKFCQIHKYFNTKVHISPTFFANKHFTCVQCCGSGSTMILIAFCRLDPDPDVDGQK